MKLRLGSVVFGLTRSYWMATFLKRGYKLADSTHVPHLLATTKLSKDVGHEDRTHCYSICSGHQMSKPVLTFKNSPMIPLGTIV